MAISQHQFYLDRKHSKNASSRKLSVIADELSHGSYSTETSSLGRSVSSLSLPTLKLDSDSCGDETLDTVELFVALKARKEALERALRRKSDELKKICIREGELTGALPPEMPLSPGEQIPIVQKKKRPIDRLLWKRKTKDEEEYARLELEYEIQNKIVSAAYKLLNDSSLKKNIRRQRKLSHQKAVAKLKEIEQRLAFFKKKESLSDDNIYHSNTEDLTQTSSANIKDAITFSPTENETEGAKNSHNKMTSSRSSPAGILRTTSSVPSSPSSSRHPTADCSSQLQGYTPSSVYQTRTSYRSQQYPTYSTRSPTSVSSSEGLTAPLRNKFESTLDLDGSNLYSVPTQRTSQAFSTQDDLLASAAQQPDLGLVSRHNSLDRKKHRAMERCMLEAKKNQPPAQRPSSVPYKAFHPPHFEHHREANLYQKNLALCAGRRDWTGLTSPQDRHPQDHRRWHVPTSVSADSLLKSHHKNVVTYGHFQPYWEETKPYETADFYKYSTKHRKQQHQVASQNLQAKLLAWKQANQAAAMSPVLERQPASSEARKEENQPNEQTDDILDWLTKQEKGKKTTLV